MSFKINRLFPVQADADFSSTVKVINDEKAKLSSEECELAKERERLNGERALLERLRGENEKERAKLQQMALRVQQESEAMDSVSKVSEPPGGALTQSQCTVDRV